MQRNDTPESKKRQTASFIAVFDSRKRKIRGLWRRGIRYYAQLRIDGRPKRIPLDAATLDQARAELEKTRTRNREGKLPSPGYRPIFSTFAGEYLASPIHAQKKRSTRGVYGAILERWKAHLGSVRLDKITDVMLNAYREKRLAQGVTARTVNKEMAPFYSVLTLANDRGLISSLPRVRQLKEKESPKRPLLSPEDVDCLLHHCTSDVTKNADVLRYYLRFLVLTGAREKEALRVRWADVDLGQRSVTIGADADSKSGHHRTVNFTPELESLMREMIESRQPDSSFLFPSPQRGLKDIPAHSLRESLMLVRSKARMPHIGFHDFRHFFASQCVMAGIDFMTIAAWLGHSDGGVLVGKVYGHLADEHKRRMADNLRSSRRPRTLWGSQ